jgi:hypothetical protein
LVLLLIIETIQEFRAATKAGNLLPGVNAFTVNERNDECEHVNSPKERPSGCGNLLTKN